MLEITSFSDINSLKEEIFGQIIIATVFEDYNLIEALRELEDEGKIELCQDKDKKIISYQILENPKRQIPQGEIRTRGQFYKFYRENDFKLPKSSVFMGTYNDVIGESAISLCVLGLEFPLLLTVATFLKSENNKIKMEQDFRIHPYLDTDQYLPIGVKLAFYKNGQKLQGFEVVSEENRNYITFQVIPEIDLENGFVENIENFEIRVEYNLDYSSLSSQEIFSNQRANFPKKPDSPVGILATLKHKLRTLFGQ